MNAVGIDVSKGKSMVAIMRPFGEIVSAPFEIKHTASDIPVSYTHLDVYKRQVFGLNIDALLFQLFLPLLLCVHLIQSKCPLRDVYKRQVSMFQKGKAWLLLCDLSVK